MQESTLCFLSAAFSDLIERVRYTPRRPYAIDSQARASLSGGAAMISHQTGLETRDEKHKDSLILQKQDAQVSLCIDQCLRKARETDEWE